MGLILLFQAMSLRELEAKQSSLQRIKEVFKLAYHLQTSTRMQQNIAPKLASYIELCHNHPSGNLKPSRADEELTNKIKEAAKYFDKVVMDHNIVSEEGFYSFADEGIL